MKLDAVVLVSAQGLDAEDAMYALRVLQQGWDADTRVLVGMDWAAALDVLPDGMAGLVLVLEGPWLSLDPRCVPRLHAALSQGWDVAVACDSSRPGAMGAVGYATLAGMERFVDAQPPGVEAVAPGVAMGVALATVPGWRKCREGTARVGRVSGAWAHDASAYFASAREEVLPLLPPGLQRVADVGGGEGGFLAAVKRVQPQAHTQLVELTHGAARRAQGRVDAVWVGDFLDWRPAERWDCIAFLEVLEHMVDPERALRHARGLLSPQGCVVLTVPNVGHWGVVADLLEGRWDWAPAGIHCYTHVRFFTEKTLDDLLARAGFRVEARTTVEVPCRPDWLAQWQTQGLRLNTASLNTYAHVLRVVPEGL